MPSINLKRKLSVLLRSHPYSLPFNSYSFSQKSLTTSILHDLASHISGNNPSQLYDYFFNNSYIGKKYFSDAKHIKKNKKILENLQKMHKNSPIKYKSSLLSLVADLYSRSELKNLGFHFSNTQFNTALKKSNNKSFKLSDYQRNIPISKSIISKQIYELIFHFLLQNSRLSTVTCHPPQLLYPLSDFNPTSVYYLEKPKKTIYLELKIQNPTIKLSLATFYKYCPKNFKKAQKKTDMCPICNEGKKAEKKLQKNELINNNTIIQLKEQINLYNQHLYFKNKQHQLYQNSILLTTTNSCIIVMDFKENFKIGSGPIETSRNFYEKTQISLLGFAIFYKNYNNIIQTQYFDFFSKILTHDSLFVIDCIKQLLSNSFMSNFNEICFWSDSGPHFKSAELIHYIFNDLSSFYTNKKIFLNYFTEYHGKNIVDSHFGILSKWFSEGESIQNIHTIEELINFFQNKAQFSSNNIQFEIYSRLQPRKTIHKLIIKDFYSYLSFTKLNNKLYVSTLSTFNSLDYKEISFKIKIIKDKRKTKYAPSRQLINDTLIPIVMGTKSREKLRIRIENTFNFPISMEI